MAEEIQMNVNDQNIGCTTEINKSVQTKGSSTVINPYIEKVQNLQSGKLLCGKYSVVKRMEIATGEADLYICEYMEKQYVAKIYRRKLAIKPEISEKLKHIDSKYVANIYETSEYNGYSVEILPYYKFGSLQGLTFDFNYLKEHIIPCLNEGIKVLHENGILHKDIKPSNIMISDNHKDVAIIDFGISSVREKSSTIVVTQTGMTPEYSAPETFRNLFLQESDYYALGVTIFELFCGYTPYHNMEQEAIEQYIAIQKIPFPDNMPKELQDLIAALTYYDITNRKDKSNPNRRWTYDEVEKWCSDVKQITPGEGGGNVIFSDMNPYIFMGNTYIEMKEFTRALAINWKEGKKQLFRGILSRFFNSNNSEIAGYCIMAEEEASYVSGKDDSIFWKLLYKLNPKTTEFYWKGHVYQGLPALGRELLETLWKNDDSNHTYYAEILNEKMLSEYIKLKLENNTKLLNAVKGLEDAQKIADNQRARAKNLYMMAYMLSGQKLMHMDGREFRTVGELVEYMKELLRDSYDEFEDFCHRMIDYDDNLEVQFESWLLALGKQKELENWRETLKE